MGDDHFFRHEAALLVAALTRVFGVQNLALAEDVAQDALCRALEVWRLRGAPDDPHAWLVRTAKKRALDVLRRERTARTFAPEITRQLESDGATQSLESASRLLDAALDPLALHDDVLRMMFSCCQPRLAEEVQIALVLQLVCGFSVGEIARAFLAGEAAIEKRLVRGKKQLQASRALFELKDAGDFAQRLLAVQRALYLLFNEGYHSASDDASVRVELCEEAMRLTSLLLEQPLAATPSTHALAALFCLHAARLNARTDLAGNLLTLEDQERAQWNQSLIAEGFRQLAASAAGDELTLFHLEAAIAAEHARAPSHAETDWAAIVRLYDTLLTLDTSPVIALNRAVAVAQLEGPLRGLLALRALPHVERLSRYPFYFAALGELTLRAGDSHAAHGHFSAALAQARSASERRFFEGRLAACTH